MKVQYILQIKYGDKWVDNKVSDTFIGIKRDESELLRTRQAKSRIIKRIERVVNETI